MFIQKIKNTVVHIRQLYISAWMEKIRQNAPLRIDGDGTQSRDFIHVDDIVREHTLYEP